jgi:hypothetical protein
VTAEVALPPVEDEVGAAASDGYGLSGGSEVSVEVELDGGRRIALLVGSDAGGGGTFVRFPDDERVYRARVGGRSLYARPPRALADRRVLACDPAEVRRVESAGWSAERSDEGWVGSPDPVDDELMEQLVAGWCSTRAAVAARERAPAEMDLALTVTLPTGPRVVRLGEADGLWYAERDGRLWQVDPGLAERLSSPEARADRRLWSLPVLDRVRWTGPGFVGELVREGAGFRIVRPANVDVEPARAEALLSALAAPRVAGWEAVDPVEAGFPSTTWLEVDGGGASARLEIGATKGDRTWVRAGQTPGKIGWVHSNVVEGWRATLGG